MILYCVLPIKRLLKVAADTVSMSKKVAFFFMSADFLKTFSSNFFKEYHQSKNLDPYQA